MIFLDLTVYLEDDNSIQYRGYTKPTDSKRYLNHSSFHPRFVFDSIPFSQLLRTLRNNSKEATRDIELKKCIQDFKDIGYNSAKCIYRGLSWVFHVLHTFPLLSSSDTFHLTRFAGDGRTSYVERTKTNSGAMSSNSRFLFSLVCVQLPFPPIVLPGLLVKCQMHLSSFFNPSAHHRFSPAF